MSADMDLVEALSNELKDEHRKALVDAYLEDPNVVQNRSGSVLVHTGNGREFASLEQVRNLG